MKQIRSGQSFLYRNAGYDSTVIEVNMTSRVTGSYLQVALCNAAKRFPYLTDKLVEKDGRYYLHKNDVSMVAVKTEKLRTLGSISTGYHLLDVTYSGNKIRVAFHHGLCDGGGVKPFVEYLLYDYCCQKYHRKFSSEGIRLLGEKIGEDEWEEPFGSEYLAVEHCDVPQIEKDGFALPETMEKKEACYRTEFIFDESTFVSEAKKVGATPSIFAAMIISKCIYDMNDPTDKAVVSNIAMDLRSVVGKEKTHRNCVGSVALPYSYSDDLLPKEMLAKKYRELFTVQREPNVIKSGINKQIGMFNKLDEIESLDKKRQMLSFFNEMTNNTYVISYLGKLRLNDYSEFIESAKFYSDGIYGLTVNMLAANGKLSLVVLQSFSETYYIQAFIKALAPYGMLSVSELRAFTTGSDKSYITASHQAERYYVKPE